MNKTMLAIAITSALISGCSNYHIEQNSRNGINVPVDSESDVDSTTSIEAEQLKR